VRQAPDSIQIKPLHAQPAELRGGESECRFHRSSLSGANPEVPASGSNSGSPFATAIILAKPLWPEADFANVIGRRPGSDRAVSREGSRDCA
jgi:hypothetical protein